VLKELAPRQRRALLLRYSGYGQCDIAKKLGISQSTISRLLEKARVLVKSA